MSSTASEAPPAELDATAVERARRVDLRRIVLVAVALAMVTVMWSYGRALTGPGNDALSVRSVEWLKDHHFTWAVNDVERWWYTHHQPKRGGVPTGALAAALRPVPTSTTADPPVASAPAVTVAPAVPPHLPPPRPLAPMAPGAVAGEGQWKPLGQPVDGVPAMYAAYLRPDPVHTSLVAAVAWMDPTLVRMVGYAGAVEPGGGPWTEQAPVAEALRPKLVAAFNSGFKMRDARGGYYADGRLARPLVPGAATLVIASDGTPNVGEWGRDVQMGPGVAFARQNLSLIVDAGTPVAGLDTDATRRWGYTVGNRVLVWRSGIGVTADGALVYAAGSSISASTLAALLARAGAVRAMELDINWSWVDFFSYSPTLMPAAPEVNKLLPDMHPSTTDYLTASSRDFVAVFRRD